MQVYQFTNGQETYLVEARNIYVARQKLEHKGVDPGSEENASFRLES